MKGKVSRERSYLYQMNGKNRGRPLQGWWGCERLPRCSQGREGKDGPTPEMLDPCSPAGAREIRVYPLFYLHQR